MTSVRAVLTTAMLAVSLSACGGGPDGKARPVPSELIPTSLGNLSVAREAKAEEVWKKLPKGALITGGHVYAIREGNSIEGDIQLAVLKDTDTGDLVNSQDERCARKPKSCTGHRALLGMQAELGKGVGFQRLYYEGQRYYTSVQSDQRIYLWFPPRSHSYVLVVLRRAFTKASSDALVRALLDFQSGRPPGDVPRPVPGTKERTGLDPLFVVDEPNSEPTPKSTATPTPETTP
jgi:hypothetical protein